VATKNSQIALKTSGETLADSRYSFIRHNLLFLCWFSENCFHFWSAVSAYLLWTKYLQYSGLNKLAWVKSLCCLRSASALVRCQMSFHRAMAFPATARPCRGPTAVKRSIFIGRYTLCRAAIMDVANYFIGVSVVSRCRRSKHRKSMASMKLVASTLLQQLTLTPTITLFLTHTHTHV